MIDDVTSRKADHLRVAAGPGVLHTAGPGLEQLRLRHRALPGRDLDEVSLTTSLLGVELAAPLMISAMTGGTAQAEAINADLAAAAAEHGVAMTLGSGRALLDDPALRDTYARLGADRPPLLLANLGGVGLDPERARRLVELLDADGLSIHLNPIQEAVQPEGEPAFADVLDRIAAAVDALAPLPVVVKEVGFGMDPEDVLALADAGVAAVDVAGAGGTNWALVEGRRDDRAGAVAAAFADWGVPTARAIISARAAVPGLPLVASGGVLDGVAAATCLALGANAVGIARPLLIAAREGRASEALGVVVRQLRIATWACGAGSVDESGHGAPGSVSRAVVIGSGLGGLAAALRLQGAGFDVTVLEGADTPGGRAGQLQEGGFTFDTGPSLITMPWVLEEAFAAGGLDFHSEVSLKRLDPFYRLEWDADDRHLDFVDRDRMPDEIARFDPRDAAAFEPFMRALQPIYEEGILGAGRRAFQTPGELARFVPRMVKLGAALPLQRTVDRFFRNPRIRESMSFHSLFIGGDPWRVPSIYGALVYLQFLDGVWYADGGVYSVVEAMARSLDVRCGDPVERIETVAGRVCAVQTRGGERIAADVVVSNTDAMQVHQLLGRPAPVRRLRPSMSCFLLYLGTNRRFDRLRHHHLLVGRDYRDFIADVTRRGRAPSTCSVYIHAPTRTEPGMAPPGGDSLCILLPVPNLKGSRPGTGHWDRMRDWLLDELEGTHGLTGLRDSIVVEQRMTPDDFRRPARRMARQRLRPRADAAPVRLLPPAQPRRPSRRALPRRRRDPSGRRHPRRRARRRGHGRPRPVRCRDSIPLCWRLTPSSRGLARRRTRWRAPSRSPAACCRATCATTSTASTSPSARSTTSSTRGHPDAEARIDAFEAGIDSGPWGPAWALRDFCAGMRSDLAGEPIRARGRPRPLLLPRRRHRRRRHVLGPRRPRGRGRRPPRRGRPRRRHAAHEHPARHRRGPRRGPRLPPRRSGRPRAGRPRARPARAHRARRRPLRTGPRRRPPPRLRPRRRPRRRRHVPRDPPPDRARGLRRPAGPRRRSAATQARARARRHSTPVSASSTSVSTTEMSSDGRQPARLEKKTNILQS